MTVWTEYIYTPLQQPHCLKVFGMDCTERILFFGEAVEKILTRHALRQETKILHILFERYPFIMWAQWPLYVVAMNILQLLSYSLREKPCVFFWYSLSSKQWHPWEVMMQDYGLTLYLHITSIRCIHTFLINCIWWSHLPSDYEPGKLCKVWRSPHVGFDVGHRMASSCCLCTPPTETQQPLLVTTTTLQDYN